METLKNTIKELVENQIFTKGQRKTIYLVGERKLNSKEAYLKALSNRSILSYHYAAYAILKGKTPEEAFLHIAEIDRKSHYSKGRVEEIVASYAPVCVGE